MLETTKGILLTTFLVELIMLAVGLAWSLTFGSLPPDHITSNENLQGTIESYKFFETLFTRYSGRRTDAWISPVIDEQDRDLSRPATFLIMGRTKQICAVWHSMYKYSVIEGSTLRWIPDIWNYLILHKVDPAYIKFLHSKYGKIDDITPVLGKLISWDMDTII